MSEPRPLHRLFGLSWTDFLEGTPLAVETEQDLSLKQQVLDLVLLRTGPGPIPRPLPDGFEELAAHNLVTFKSHQEALDGWAVLELIGHYVNYRKQSSPSMQNLLPEGDYRLFAVCARFPQQLAQRVALSTRREGVYELRVATATVRIIVAAQLPEQEQNAMLHLFSASLERLRYGRDHYRPYSKETSTLLNELFKVYTEETDMPDNVKEFAREALARFLNEMTPEKRLEGLTAEEVARALSPEVRQELARILKANGPTAKPQ
jgi:hypothetical protein